MTGLGGAAAGAVGDAGRPNTVSEPVRGRDELADALRTLTEDLKTASGRLKRAVPGLDEGSASAGPEEEVASLWRTGLQEVLGWIKKVDRLQGDCQATVTEQSKASGKADTAQPALTQLEQAVGKAFGAIRSALHSLQLPDQSFLLEGREDSYMKAVGQLDELASRCTGLVVLMLGQKALEEG